MRTTARIASPVTFAATILLPIDWTQWSAAKREAVLAHESTHVRQHDFYVLLLAQVHRAIYWFNPLAWWLPKQLGQLSEIISDEAAMRTVMDRPTYANMLLEFARDVRRIPTVLSMAKPSTVMARIEYILNETTRFTKPNWRARIGAVIGMAPLIALAACTSTNDHALSAAKPKDVVVVPKYLAAHLAPWPKYPAQSLRGGEEGTALVDVHVGKDGSVLEARLKRSSGFPALDEASLEVVRTRWQLNPGTVNGTPRDMWVTVPMVFKLTKPAPPPETVGSGTQDALASPAI